MTLLVVSSMSSHLIVLIPANVAVLHAYVPSRIWQCACVVYYSVDFAQVLRDPAVSLLLLLVLNT